MSALAHHGDFVTGAPVRTFSRKASQRTRSANWKLAALVIALAALAAVMAGCASKSLTEQVLASDPPQTNNHGRPAARLSNETSKVAFDGPGETDFTLAAATPETRLLAAQSEQDVQHLLGSNRAAPKSVPHVAERPPPVPNVMWNDLNVLEPNRSSLAGASVGQPSHGIEQTPTSSAATTQPSAAADVDADVPGLRPDRLRQLTVDLARELYAQGAYSDQPLRELTLIAAMSMLDENRRIDPAAIPDLTDDERQVLGGLQTFLTEIGVAMEGGDALANQVSAAAGRLRDGLIEEPRLTLATVALCTRVGGFGDYTAFERSTFLAGAEQKAIVYLEIRNFVSDINQDNAYVTELSQQLTIYSDRDGIPVWKEDWQPATDVSRNKRQDFFTVQVITLPKALSVGRYTLKARVRDEKSRAETETSIPLELVADPKMIDG